MSPDERLSQAATELFASTYGVEPEGVWRAPGRVNLIGEHVDYNAGLCLPIALPQSTFAAVRSRDDDRIRLVSAQEPDASWEGTLEEVAPGTPSGWAGYLAGVLWALRAEGVDVPGVDVAVDSDVPVGAGLSSSAALECSLGLAVAELVGLETDDEGRARLAAACVRAENEIAMASTGGLDQTASLRSRAGNALLIDCLDHHVEHVPLDLEAAGLALLVCDTRAPHRLVDSEYTARRQDCVRACELLGVASLREVTELGAAERVLAPLAPHLVPRVRHVVGEIARVREFVDLLRADRPGDVGPLLDASHTSLRYDYEVSSPELDLAVESASAAGALGARMTGGGFGGSIVALVRSGDLATVSRAIETAFDSAGLAPPAFVTAIAGGPAGRC